MVKAVHNLIRTHKHSFELVMLAYELRFPTCDMIPVIEETNILEEVTDDNKGTRFVDRRVKTNVKAPYLIKKVIGVEHLLFRQQNTLNREKRTLTTEAWNETFDNILELKEVCKYSVHPENPDWTTFEQSASFDIKSFYYN